MSLRRRFAGLGALLAGTSAPIPLRSRAKAWRHGFSGWTWLLYDLDNNDYRDYVPNKLSGRMANIDGPIARSVLKNKLLFEQILGEHVRVPRVFGALERGSLTRLREDFAPASAAELVEWVVGTARGVFIKPVDSSEGRGAMSLEARDGLLLVDKKPSDVATAVRLVADQDGAIVTELVTQGQFGRSVFPDAVNTLRVITMIDPEGGEPFIVSAIHRFGTAASAPTDNISRHAIRTTIDVATGTMSIGAASWAHENGAFTQYAQHPETGAQLEGVVVPGWPAVVAKLLGLVRRFPMLAYVGWDAVIGDEDVILIEGNHSPNLTQQVTGPYLADPRVRRFLESRDVLEGTGL